MTSVATGDPRGKNRGGGGAPCAPAPLHHLMHSAFDYTQLPHAPVVVGSVVDVVDVVVVVSRVAIPIFTSPLDTLPAQR